MLINHHNNLNMINTIRNTLLTILISLASLLQAQTISWADSVFNTLTTRDKIAQLMIVRANYDKQYIGHEKIDTLLQHHKIGGITFFGGTPTQQARFTNQWQQKSKIPLFISIDAEWGVAMRLDSVSPFPRAMTLGAIQNNDLITQMGQYIGDQCNTLGIHINFAPVADINNNPENPVINTRSFGQLPYNVAQKCAAYVHGMQSRGVMAVAKHFPGHGDTHTDSHFALPVVNHTLPQLDSLDLIPFKYLANQNVGGVMVGHLHVPAIDPLPNSITTTSAATHNLLRQKTGFKGLTITDGLDMQGITKYIPTQEVEVQALLAGNDILLLPRDVPRAIENIQQAINKGTLSVDTINNRCMKILRAKEALQVHHTPPVDIHHLVQRLNPPKQQALIHTLYASSITLLQNPHHLIPLVNTDTIHAAIINIGSNAQEAFNQTLSNYFLTNQFTLPLNATPEQIRSLNNKLAPYNLIVIALQPTVSSKKQYGITREINQFIHQTAQNTAVILNLMGNPYALNPLDSLNNLAAVIVSYQNNSITATKSAEIIAGALPAKGVLPVEAGTFLPGTGLNTFKTRLHTALPEEVGMCSDSLSKIDSLALEAIRLNATPGCQILVVKDTAIIYNRCFGYHTYQQKIPVQPTDLYDMASVTKIAATTLAVMNLHNRKLINIDRPLAWYLPFLRNSNKSHMVIRDILTHQAALQAWIPFYSSTLTNGHPDTPLYTSKPDITHSLRVANNLYIDKKYTWKIFDSITTSPLRTENHYKYSDLGFYLLYRTVEWITNQPFDEFVAQQYYTPLNLRHTTFKPRNSHPLSQIVPTENDTYFRHQLIHGDVHDPGAAMLGGVSGHAGLFSNAGDMAVIMQLLLNNGRYGGKQYLTPQTVEEFTTMQFPINDNRRGLGFDKPVIDPTTEGPSCPMASPDSFGHSGFTGTLVWADPQHQLIYIFLSNRVHPDGTNTLLIKNNYRTRIQQIIYNSIINH